mmetsp:Transcript_4686/g.9283  ORF Transcript_4686/g.9283 Transcript_4686/m.9283 type:complete len:104 (+) Transcript_4686:1-312(+)
MFGAAAMPHQPVGFPGMVGGGFAQPHGMGMGMGTMFGATLPGGPAGFSSFPTATVMAKPSAYTTKATTSLPTKIAAPIPQPSAPNFTDLPPAYSAKPPAYAPE